VGLCQGLWWWGGGVRGWGGCPGRWVHLGGGERALAPDGLVPGGGGLPWAGGGARGGCRRWLGGKGGGALVGLGLGGPGRGLGCGGGVGSGVSGGGGGQGSGWVGGRVRAGGRVPRGVGGA